MKIRWKCLFTHLVKATLDEKSHEEVQSVSLRNYQVFLHIFAFMTAFTSELFTCEKGSIGTNNRMEVEVGR